jgi:hypothetical protein
MSLEKNKRYVVQIQFQMYSADDQEIVANTERILAKLKNIENERILSIDENSWGSFDLREVDVSTIQRETLAKQLNDI